MATSLQERLKKLQEKVAKAEAVAKAKKDFEAAKAALKKAKGK